MYSNPAVFMLIENILIFFLYMLIKKKLPLKQSQINFSSAKKQFWEKVLMDQAITELPQCGNQEGEQQSYSTPRNEHIIQQYWFLQKFFLRFVLLNYTHAFHFITIFKKEWKIFNCRNQQFHWNSLLLPLIFYQLSAYISFQTNNYGLFIGGLLLFSSLNLCFSFIYNPKFDLDKNMRATCLKITKLRELFSEQKQIILDDQKNQDEQREEQSITSLINVQSNYFPNLILYNNLLQQNSEPKFYLALFGLSFLLSFQIKDIYWEFTFSWLYGLMLEQLVRIVFCIIYSKRLTTKWILQGPDQVYHEMQILAEVYKPMMLVSKSPQKYIMNETNVNISGMSKDQSNLNIMNHNSTHDLINNKHQILRITSANLGTIEDTKLDITENVKEMPIIDSDQALDTEQNNNKEILRQKSEQDTQPEDQFKKKKIQRVKLDALYHSKVTNRSPKPNLPRPQFYSSQKNKQNEQELEKTEEQKQNIIFNNEFLENDQKVTIKQEDLIQFQYCDDENSPPPEFNPIEFLKNISPIGSQVSQRNQIPHQWEEPDEEEACNFKSSFHNDFQDEEFDRGVTPKIIPLQQNNNINNKSPTNQSLVSGALSKFGTGSKPGTVARRNVSQKTSKEEEEKSFKEFKKIKVKSLTRSRRSSPEKKNKLTLKPRGESMKVRNNKKDEIPTLNFDSARFKSPYLEFFPGMKDSQQQQRTHRKQNISANNQKIKQIIQSYENIQTSNENRNQE